MGTMGELSIMGIEGDTKTIWDPSKEDEVEVARNTFDRLKAKGYMIYRVDEDGGKGEVMHKFEPRAGKLIAVPRIVGG